MDDRQKLKHEIANVILKTFDRHELSLNEGLEIAGGVLMDILYQYKLAFPEDYVSFVQNFLSCLLINVEIYVKHKTDKVGIDIQSQIDSIFEKGLEK